MDRLVTSISQKSPAAARYLAKRQLYPFQIRTPPPAGLGLVVVIPCYDEPDLNTTLDSLWRCARPAVGAEVLIVFNASEADDRGVGDRYRDAFASARDWIETHPDPALRFHLLDYPSLPARHAGVGLARKLGMDEAVARLAVTAGDAGLIASLDADCIVDSDYLNAIDAHFGADPARTGAAIYFEHPIAAGADGEAIARYELHLRYYVHGLRYAGSPYAFHTVGSCLAVRGGAYVRQGGMNRRQAGEDFYFTQKLIAAGGFSALNETTVRPSDRPSHRVPFGTGRAIREGAGETLSTYAPSVFNDLRRLFERIETLERCDPDAAPIGDLAPPMVEFLERNEFGPALAEIQANTAGPASFRKRWFRWFNGFRCMKYANFATRLEYPKVPVEQAAATLLAGADLVGAEVAGDDLRDLLDRYRRLDRSTSA